MLVRILFESPKSFDCQFNLFVGNLSLLSEAVRDKSYVLTDKSIEKAIVNVAYFSAQLIDTVSQVISPISSAVTIGGAVIYAVTASAAHTDIRTAGKMFPA